jgi:hypothetical protein
MMVKYRERMLVVSRGREVVGNSSIIIIHIVYIVYIHITTMNVLRKSTLSAVRVSPIVPIYRDPNAFNLLIIIVLPSSIHPIHHSVPCLPYHHHYHHHHHPIVCPSHTPSPPNQSFSTTTRLSDLSRVQLIGRIGADPVIRTAEKTGAPYIVYPIATAAGSWGPADADGSE